MPRGRVPHDGLPIGTTRKDKDGYTIIKVSASPHVWVRAHRWSMEKKLGRPLAADEVVHHQCHDKTCYDPEHLELLSPGAHRTLHNLGSVQSEAQVAARKTAQRAWWKKPGVKDYRANLMVNHWQDPEYRARQSASRKASWARRKADPAFVAPRGRVDAPETIQRRTENLRRYWNSPEGRAASKAQARARWADPAYRAAQAAAREARRVKTPAP